MLALLAMLERVGAGDLDAAEATARQALAVAEEAGDVFATARALAELWLTHGVRRDHAAALDYIDRALRVLGDDPGHAGLRSYGLDGRVFTLQNLDRWPEAELALRQAREFAQRTGSPDSATWVTAAVLRYWLGQWDDALAELGFDDAVRGCLSARTVARAAVARRGRADRRTPGTAHTAAQQLRKGLALPNQILTDRENQDFLVAAHALALEQSGETRQAMARLAAMLPRRNGEMTLIHQWLPDLVRLAFAAGDRQIGKDCGAGLPGRGRGRDPAGPGRRGQPTVSRAA